MVETHHRTFLIILGFLFLLPIFFIPGGVFNLEPAKSFLLVFAVVLATIVFLWESWRAGSVSIIWHYSILAAALLPVVYFLSAVLSAPSSPSLFGYNFEEGTFGFIFAGSLLLVLISTVFTSVSRVLQASAAVILSLLLIGLFSIVKILSGGFPVWGIFLTNTATPVGRWTDLASTFGLLAIISALVIGMIQVKRFLRIALYIVFALSTLLLVIINFSLPLIFTAATSILLYFYFNKIEKHFLNISSPQAISERFYKKPVFLPILLGVISIIAIIDPQISGDDTVSDVLSRTFNVASAEVRPSLSATLSISKSALSSGTILGSGPNTFSRDWLIYKPSDINLTPF